MSAVTGTPASTTTDISSEIWLLCPVLVSLPVAIPAIDVYRLAVKIDSRGLPEGILN